MSERQRWMVGGLVVLVPLAVFLWWVQHRQDRARTVPQWTHDLQPPRTVGLIVASPEASWAANRCLPMAAPCNGGTAGRIVMRDYPGTLATAPYSFIRTGAQLEAGI
jgi:hypothetical protein